MAAIQDQWGSTTTETTNGTSQYEVDKIYKFDGGQFTLSSDDYREPEYEEYITFVGSTVNVPKPEIEFLSPPDPYYPRPSVQQATPKKLLDPKLPFHPIVRRLHRD